MTTRCLIVDDEPLSRRVITGLLEDHRDFVVAGEAEDARQAIESIERLKPDVVFLDVQMPEMSGFDLLRELDQNALPLVVFVTAFDHHAVRAFEARAIDYLLKPVERDRFALTIARVRELLQGGGGPWMERLRRIASEVDARRYRQRIVVRSRERIFFVGVAEIDWLESAANYVRIHAGPRQHLVRTTLQQLESELDPEVFARIHRSMLVNLQRIQELQPFFRGEFVAVLKSGERLEVQRPYRNKLLAKFESAGTR